MITAVGARRALKKRKNVVVKPLVLDARAVPQNAFVEDPARYIAAQCSRRAGKSTGLGLRFVRTMEKHPKSQSLYLSLTRESAQEIMWPVMHELDETYGLGLTFIESKLTIIHPNGARLRLLGADMKNFIKRIKGRKFPAVAVDEAQDFGTHLQSLLDDVLTPSIADYVDGWIAVTGTPGPVPQGYFFDITQKRKYGYSFHAWTILENPFMPDPAGFIRDLKAKREWDDENPTLKREWKNLWVLDTKSLWIQYTDAVNHYQDLPKLPAGQLWNYILGIDIGFKDADALALVAWSEAVPETYLVKEVITTKQDITALAEQIQQVQKDYPISKMVMDEGALGKKAAEELRRRWKLPIHPADKHRKQENVEILNDNLRRGKFKAKSASRFALDSYLIQIDWDKSTPDRIVIKKNPHSDIIDAVLYAFRESPAYAFQAPPVKHKPGTREAAKAEEDAMFEAELAYFQEIAERERRYNGDYS